MKLLSLSISETHKVQRSLDKAIVKTGTCLFLFNAHLHWLGVYRTNALYSGHIFVRFNDLGDVFT